MFFVSRININKYIYIFNLITLIVITAVLAYKILCVTIILFKYLFIQSLSAKLYNKTNNYLFKPSALD